MIKKALLFSIAVIFLLVLPTFIPLGEYDSKEDMEIFLVSNDIHIGLAVPVENPVYDWRTFFKLDIPPEKIDWIEFGWGDRRFYFEMPTWEQFTLGIAADALFIPDPAVMHVEFLTISPENYKNSIRIRLSFSTYQKMVDAIRSWFVLKDGQPILIPGKGYGKMDNFYEAKESYSILKTCNNWTSDILASAGLKHPLWSPTKYGLELIWKSH